MGKNSSQRPGNSAFHITHNIRDVVCGGAMDAFLTVSLLSFWSIIFGYWRSIINTLDSTTPRMPAKLTLMIDYETSIYSYTKLDDS